MTIKQQQQRRTRTRTLYPVDVYEVFLSMRNHFDEGTSYDAIKYRYKMFRGGGIKTETFDKNRDKFKYVRLSEKFKNREDVAKYFAAYLITDPNIWITEIVNNPDIYTAWKKRNMGISYLFESEVRDVLMPLDGLLTINNKNESPYPRIINKYMAGMVSIETIIMFDTLTDFICKIKTCPDPFFWPSIKFKIKSYRPFVSFDDVRIKRILSKYLKTT